MIIGLSIKFVETGQKSPDKIQFHIQIYILLYYFMEVKSKYQNLCPELLEMANRLYTCIGKCYNAENHL